MSIHVEIIEERPSCRIWDAETGKAKAKLEGHSAQINSAKINSVAISSDGKTIVSGAGDYDYSDNTIR